MKDKMKNFAVLLLCIFDLVECLTAGVVSLKPEVTVILAYF